jgi:ankyrin repeat protein
LHLAVINEDKRCLEILLKNEADISTQNMEGLTPLDICKSP